MVIPDGSAAKSRSDSALVEVLAAHTNQQPWWLGYLETGVADVVQPDAPRTAVYGGWPYVLLSAGPGDALTSRRNEESTPWHSALPELLFPADRSWLVSTMWDDHWRCIGGTEALVRDVLAHRDLDARSVTTDEDATPSRG